MMRTTAIAISLGFLMSAGPADVRAATDPADACTDAKAKAVGKKASALLKAFGKNIKKSNPLKLSMDVAKAQSKLTKAFVKAESKGGCATIGDVGAMEAKVDALVADAIDGFDCNCCGEVGAAAFLTIDGTGVCGTLRRFSCADPGGVPNFTNHVCTSDPDCNLGPCVSNQCSGDTGIACGGDMDCVSTCVEIAGGGLPMNLQCGGLYTGGGLNTVPLPLKGPDMNAAIAEVTSCNDNVMTLGPTTPAQVGALHCTQGRQCSGSSAPCVVDADCPALQTCDDLCLFGAPLPVPNTLTPPVSVCSVNVVAEDTSGTLNCEDGSGTTTTNLRAVIYLNGDLLNAPNPPDVPGVQPCPLCTTVCVGGTNAGFPCVDDTDCDSGDCGSTGNRCLAGPNDGDPCTPGTSRLDVHDCCVGGSQNTQRCNPGVSCSGGGVCTPGCTSFPTSHDCPPDPLQDITTTIGGLPIGFSTTTGTETRNAEDLRFPQALKVFCGFCRDTLNGGSLCFEGDLNIACPTAIPAADGNAVACTSNADCADGDSYETCSQRDGGAFSRASATTMTIAGSTDGQCLEGYLEEFECHDATLASIFCIPPTFDPSVDAAGNLPGPGATTLIGLRRVAPDVSDFFPIDTNFCPAP
jgi:hypothetical protein